LAPQVAVDIAAKSPLAVWGTKRILLRARDGGGIARGLDYVALHNAAFLLSDDIARILAAGRTKQQPVFSKL
jgi:delta(3,5)-delta(2,4)-dienoyl-CoA isomerase